MGSKLNMKSAQYGSPVEWHQDWAFYPHSNDDVLAIDVLLDDCDLENGQMMVTPRSHTSQSVWNHHGDDGCFAGLIDPDLIQDEINRAVPCAGKAGSMSFHHVRALHGSATNTSNKPRNLVLYEVAASDAGPLMGVKDFAEYDSRCWRALGGHAAAHRRAGANAAAAGETTGLDLRDPVGGEEVLFYPRSIDPATMPAVNRRHHCSFSHCCRSRVRRGRYSSSWRASRAG
jgi:ectoine hydroxylase-related dioxygenase (phytanoyl-CoA dioxygenase family)